MDGWMDAFVDGETMQGCGWMNEWMRHLYSALSCIAVHPKLFTVMWGVSLQPPPVCSIHLDDAMAATGQHDGYMKNFMMMKNTVNCNMWNIQSYNLE